MLENVEADFLSYSYDPADIAETCQDDLSGINWFVILSGIVIALGVWISWLPQQVTFVVKKSTFGVSFWYILLTQVANWCPFINAVYLSWDLFHCCASYVSFWDCQKLLLALYQLAISVFSVTCIYICYVIYYDPVGPPDMVEPQNQELDMEYSDAVFDITDKAMIDQPQVDKKRQQGRRTQIIIFIVYYIFTAIAVSVGFVMIFAAGPYSPPILFYSLCITTVGVLSVLIQFTPQIYVTWKLKSSGNLSLVMLILQAPGTWVWLVYLIYYETWTTWLSTLVAATQVTILLCQVVYYDFIAKRYKGEAEAEKILSNSSPNVQ